MTVRERISKLRGWAQVRVAQRHRHPVAMMKEKGKGLAQRFRRKT